MHRNWARRVKRFADYWQFTAHCRREPERCRAVVQADSRTRPWRRRALMTARPARVAIRWRKPCLLDLLRVLGWNVRFISTSFRRSGATRRWCLPTRRWSSETGAIDPPRGSLQLARENTGPPDGRTGPDNLAHDPWLDQAASLEASNATGLYDSAHTLRARPAVHTCGCWCGELLDRRASSW